MADNGRTILDVDLTARDVQDISSADGVAAFFAKLGYNTNIRIIQSPANLDITTESTRKALRWIELIADREGLFQIYLFETVSVTIALIRSLSKVFRDRAGNYLLVLTSDYQKLDFVLIEKMLPKAGKPEAFGQKQIVIRPRVLTVDRTKPERTQLRILRRLTWTESDPFFQYDKLLSAYTVADWTEEYFDNRALFSDHYLLHRLVDFPEWQEDPKPTYRRLRELYKAAASRFARQRVDLLHQELYEPVFDLLGFRAVREGVGRHGEIGPHYRLFPQGSAALPLAMCRTYPWARSLDGKDDQRDSETGDENPGAVVVTLLERSECPWVILTNGQTWRLYSRQTHSRATNYYEIDVKELLADFGSTVTDSSAAFRYFWLLFRRAAFEPKAAYRAGQLVNLSLLDLLLFESEDYAKELGERLKERVFEDVFPHIAEGFIANIRQRDGLNADLSQPALDAVFEGTLTILYRLLFLLYAEARSLLPVKEVRGYFEASLTKLREELHEAGGKIEDEAAVRLKKTYRDDFYELYDRLTKLFHTIDTGDTSVNVPVYNGGLFLSSPTDGDSSPEARIARFLQRTQIPDRFLARALHLLVHDVDDKRHDLVFVDYKSLGVRQLGSIYEGLLEFRLRVASGKMAIVKGKNTEEIVPYAEAKRKNRVILVTGRGQSSKERTLSKGEAYLENDRQERKITGSYYTPDHIVIHIVENTVGPVLEHHFERMRPKLREAQQSRRAFFEKQDALKKRGLRPEPESKADYIGEVLVNEIFNIKVLDPAMGSGHFLVETVDYITDKALDFLNGFPWNPVSAHLSRMRDEILSEMESQGITIDAAKLTDVNLLKRHVLKRCVYGVDLNPMAVELAKVSLWLDCFTLGAPLSFLDHHLRCGNSLVGATVDDAREAIRTGQLSLLSGNRFEGLKQAVAGMISVGGLSDVTAAQVQQSRSKYKESLDYLLPIKRLVDVYLSQWFGNKSFTEGHGKKRRERNRALEFLRDISSEMWAANPKNNGLDDPEWQEVAMQTETASLTTKFFHWELEYPEVFYGSQPGNGRTERLTGGGFDVVLGNPPWVSTKQIPEVLRQYFWSTQRALLIEEMDYYELFIALSERLLVPNGKLGFVIPNTWYTNRAFEHLRSKVILGTFRPSSLVDYPYRFFPFPEVNKETCILVMTLGATSDLFPCFIVRKQEVIEHPVIDKRFAAGQKSVGKTLSRPHAMLFLRETPTTDRMDRIEKRLGDFVEAHKGWMSIPKQTRTRLRLYKQELFTPDEIRADKELRELCSPCARGEDTQYFYFMGDVYADSLVYVNSESMDKETESWQFQPKVICQRITGQNSRRFIAAPDLKKRYVSHPSTNLLFFKQTFSKYSLLRLLGLLNSDCMNEYYKTLFGETNTNITADVLEFLPVPNGFFEPENTAGQAVERLVTDIMNNIGAESKQEPLASASFVKMNRVIEGAFGLSPQG